MLSGSNQYISLFCFFFWFKGRTAHNACSERINQFILNKLKPIAMAFPRSLLKRQNLKLHLRSTKSESAFSLGTRVIHVLEVEALIQNLENGTPIEKMEIL